MEVQEIKQGRKEKTGERLEGFGSFCIGHGTINDEKYNHVVEDCPCRSEPSFLLHAGQGGKVKVVSGGVGNGCCGGRC